jgi:RNA polymerase sigma factor (sigma-70 family)
MASGLQKPGMDDSGLIARVTDHDDHEAFAILIGRHQGAVRAVLKRLAKGDVALADDLAQATLIRAYTTLAGFRGTAQFRTWLYRIACNEFFQYRRLARVSREVPLDDEPAESFPMSATGASGIDLSIDLERALASLTDGEREAIIVCFYADMSHSEAAELLDCALGTLKSHVQRARKKLGVYLAAWAPTVTEVSR